MALTGAERTARYRQRARERGEALEALPPVPQSARELVSGIIAEAIVRAGKIKDRGDRERLIGFWRELASSQELDLERDRLGVALDRRARAAAQLEGEAA